MSSKGGLDDGCAPITFAERLEIRHGGFLRRRRLAARSGGLRLLDGDRVSRLKNPRTLDVVGNAHNAVAGHVNPDH